MKEAIIGGGCAVLGIIAGAFLTGWFELQVGRQKLDSALVMKALAPDSGEKRVEFLNFLVKTRLINDSEIRAGVSAYAESKASDPDSVPQISGGGSGVVEPIIGSGTGTVE